MIGSKSVSGGSGLSWGSGSKSGWKSLLVMCSLGGSWDECVEGCEDIDWWCDER